MLRVIIGTVSYIWVVMAITSVAQPNPAVVDTAGHPLQPAIEYYILPGAAAAAAAGDGGGLTLIDRNGSCPLYVGQEDLVGSQGLPVIFTPFFAQDTIIRESMDFRLQFSAATICVQSTAWRVGESEPETGRRLIVTGRNESAYDAFFRINREGNGDAYNLAWCPTDVCPICRFQCGSAGVLLENGRRLLALDGPALPVVFRKA